MVIAVYFSEQASVISVKAIFTGYQKMDNYQSNDFATHMLKSEVSHNTHLCPCIIPLSERITKCMILLEEIQYSWQNVKFRQLYDNISWCPQVLGLPTKFVALEIKMAKVSHNYLIYSNAN